MIPSQPVPVPPDDLPPVARAVLEGLRAEPDEHDPVAPAVGASLVIGGGVALKHYLNLRPTHDLDLWWTREPAASGRRALELVVAAVAREHGYLLRQQSHGDVTSIAFVRADNPDVADFAVEVATRDVQLAPYGESAWPPVLLESFADNVASKMVALVSRGHWRDFADIYAVVSNGLITTDACWVLWARKQQGLGGEVDRVSAEASVLRHLARIRQSRPIESIQEPAERARATALRAWFGNDFTAGVARGSASAPDSPRQQVEGVAEHVAQDVAEETNPRTPEP